MGTLDVAGRFDLLKHVVMGTYNFCGLGHENCTVARHWERHRTYDIVEVKGDYFRATHGGVVQVDAERLSDVERRRLLAIWREADTEDRTAANRQWNDDFHERQAQQAGYLHIRYHYKHDTPPALRGYPSAIIGVTGSGYRKGAGSDRAEAGLSIRQDGQEFEVLDYGRDPMLGTPFAIVRIFGLWPRFRVELPEIEKAWAKDRIWDKSIRRAVNLLLGRNRPA